MTESEKKLLELVLSLDGLHSMRESITFAQAKNAVLEERIVPEKRAELLRLACEYVSVKRRWDAANEGTPSKIVTDLYCEAEALCDGAGSIGSQAEFEPTPELKSLVADRAERESYASAIAALDTESRKLVNGKKYEERERGTAFRKACSFLRSLEGVTLPEPSPEASPTDQDDS